ncbi:pitrilysin family protein [Erythrobacter sp. YT30]|uniref:M16 family metallopeptidase n=1 Tax=Erythrobacter sp. YT30 TaxID=1735012 RepID=UPI00076DBBD4|nr:insulinase family protein [Erythrobacter sp. YT30]KWV90523.1 peptidase M16 [Erythrobacter sp. YT30]
MKFTKYALACGLLLALPNLALSQSLAAQDTETSASQDVAADPVWPFETSDIPTDPRFVYGRLDNGMRYILRQNATPQGTALVRMRIDSGSLEETEDERGLAHYLEHMAFNGSTNIPEGEMIKLLEREGLQFGADTNAATGLESVTYKLNLPRNDEDLLDIALMLMRETASELTIAEDAVERERGVILAERRDRRGFRQRAAEDSYAFSAPGARFAERLPIGTLDVLQSADAADIRALYERTYTPANTIMVIVGDFSTDVMEAKIKERFADWQGPPAPPEPVTGPIDPTRGGETDIYLDPALSESVSIFAMAPWLDEPDTQANRDKRLLRGIGYGIINRRLTRLARSEDAPFRGASFGTSNFFEDARSTGINVASADGEWEKGVLAAVQVMNEALTYGFTQAEVDEQLANRRTAAKNAVKAAETRSNAAYVGSAMRVISAESVLTTPQYRLEQFERMAPNITPEAVFEELKSHVADLDNPLIRFQGRTAPAGGKEALRDAFTSAMALPIAPPEDAGPIEFAYTDFGEPGEVVEDNVEERLGIRRIRFANGVRLNLKKTDVSEDRISVLTIVDGGVLLNTKDDPLKTYLTSSLPAGGLGEHSRDELSTVLAGRSVGNGFTANGDGFSLTGGTTPRDLELQLQLITAMITDPGYRTEAVARFRKGIDNYFETLTSTPGRAYGTAIGGIVSDQDPRYALPSKESYYALDFDRLKAAIGDRLENGAIEVSIVGDLDEEATIAAVAKTLGALPDREPEFLQREEARTRAFTADRTRRTLFHQGEEDQALLRMVWPTTDDSDLAEAVRLRLLASVVRIELSDRLREELGQAYSPTAGSSTSRIYRDYGTFALGSSLEAANVDAAREAIYELLNELRDAPIDPDLLDRARKPIQESYDNLLKGLRGWMGLARFAQSQPQRIERYFDYPEVLASVTPEGIQATAVKYLDPDEALEVLVLPEGNGAADEN